MTVVPVRLWRWSHGRSSQGPVVRHRIWYLNPYRPSNAPCSGKTIFLYIWFGDVDVYIYIYIHRYPPHPTCTWCLFLAGFYLASSHTVQRWIQLIPQISLVTPSLGTCMMKCIKRLGWLALSLRRSSRPWCFSGHLRFVRSEKLGVCEKCVVFLWCAYISKLDVIWYWKKFSRILGFFLG